MADIRDKHRDAYKEEANELLSELEISLLELEETPEDMDVVGRVFRAMHTIKGSGAMFGFDDIASFTHQVETVFDLVRNGKLKVTKEIINLTLSARDHINILLNSTGSIPAEEESKAEGIISSFKALLPKDDKAQKSGPETKKNEASPEGGMVTYRIRFKPLREIFMTGTNPVYLLNDLRQLGSCRVIAQTREIPDLEELNPEHCYMFWDILLTSDRGEAAISDIFVFVSDDSEVRIDIIDQGGAVSDKDEYSKIGEILVERGDVKREEFASVMEDRKLIGDILVEKGLVDPGQIESALEEQKHVREVRKERQKDESSSTIRVPSEKLDQLVDLVGELVTVQARLSQTAKKKMDAILVSISEEVERLTAELHDNTMSIRMVPIGTTFSKFRRLVRDLSANLGKEVKLTTDGAETELDKTVIERLSDPLVHMIRNCIDHGVEDPDVRADAGKPREGTVHLAAVHSGANVIIEIRDDGAGIDPEALRAKAVERGIITHDAQLSEKEMFNLIFAPGFSMARKVTDVSGRGVGMDVVKRSIDSLRGQVDISSKKGLGTSMKLRIPLTLAIIEGLLVRVQGDFFVFPLSAVLECVELKKKDIDAASGRHIINVRGDIVPYIRLRERFGIGQNRPAIEQVVIVEVEGARIGFTVDSVVGGHQTVIKTLGSAYRDVDGVSGATILGDGTVALILDIPNLYHGAELDEHAMVNKS